jgi:Flp pilus assembly protein TadB
VAELAKVSAELPRAAAASLALSQPSAQGIRPWVDAAWPGLAYREAMGRLLLILLAAFAVFMLISLVISALHFLFWVALVVVIVLGALRLSSGMRRRSRR